MQNSSLLTDEEENDIPLNKPPTPVYIEIPRKLNESFSSNEEDKVPVSSNNPVMVPQNSYSEIIIE